MKLPTPSTWTLRLFMRWKFAVTVTLLCRLVSWQSPNEALPQGELHDTNSEPLPGTAVSATVGVYQADVLSNHDGAPSIANKETACPFATLNGNVSSVPFCCSFSTNVASPVLTFARLTVEDPTTYPTSVRFSVWVSPCNTNVTVTLSLLPLPLPFPFPFPLLPDGDVELPQATIAGNTSTHAHGYLMGDRDADGPRIYRRQFKRNAAKFGSMRSQPGEMRPGARSSSPMTRRALSGSPTAT